VLFTLTREGPVDPPCALGFGVCPADSFTHQHILNDMREAASVPKHDSLGSLRSEWQVNGKLSTEKPGYAVRTMSSTLMHALLYWGILVETACGD
jgi:hypothetical protein